MNSKLANIIATYFGFGLSKFAPGTMGSLGSVPLAYFLIYYGGVSLLLISAIILFFVGVKATDVVIKESNIEDPSKVVIDETVGQLLTFSLVALIYPNQLLGIQSLVYYVCGFALFRFFDIKKMGPVKYADTKINNAYGVMLDDVFAGIFASIVLLGIIYLQLNI
jgi:phosphatidylglycerophosphatase A